MEPYTKQYYIQLGREWLKQFDHPDAAFTKMV